MKNVDGGFSNSRNSFLEIEKKFQVSLKSLQLMLKPVTVLALALAVKYFENAQRTQLTSSVEEYDTT